MAQRLGNVPVGTLLKIQMGVGLKSFIVVHQGKPSSIYDDSCNGTWLLLQDVWGNSQWNSNYDNTYVNSIIKDLENSSGFISDINAALRAKVKTVKIPYCQGNGSFVVKSGANGYSCRMFLLSGAELGFIEDSGHYPPEDGAKLAYFASGYSSSANSKRKAKLNGYDATYWTRSAYSNKQSSWTVYSDGDAGYTSVKDDLGIRPAIILPTDLIVDDSNTITANTYPDPPTSITVPTEAIPTGSTISITWAAVTGSTYKLQRSVDGGSWADVYTGGNNSYSDTAGIWNKVKYRVASVKSGITSGYTESKEVQILPYTVDKITAPSQVMEGQQVPVSWSSVAAANTYVLERKSSAADWAQIYSGADTQFTDTPEGGWTSVQYRVKAGKDGTFGGYTTSPEIPVISASALVISGQDGDLGTLTNDVPYTVSSDTGNPITVERFVNGSLVARVTVESGFAYSIPVMELPTGAGTIKLVCSVTPSSSGPVTATRIWGYTKAVVQFPEEGGPAVLQQEGKKVLPITLAECIEVPVNWGGSLDKSLELLLPLLNTAVMATGSYTGTGTFGQDNPNELTFTFGPEIVIVSGASGSITISNKEPSGGQSDGYIQNQKATWYSTSAAKQLNVQGEKYSYWAVGKAVQT